MKYLFIDASENLTHVQTGTEKDFNAKTIDTNRDFAAKITEICDNMLKEAGWKKEDLTHLVVCTGPGSLTGLRVADGFLRTLAMVLNIPLIGIDLFKWSVQTLSDNSFEGEARLVMPTLIDKAFEVNCYLSNNPSLRAVEDCVTIQKDLEIRDKRQEARDLFGDNNYSFQNRHCEPLKEAWQSSKLSLISDPVLIEKKAIPSDTKTFGIRYNHEAAERIDPTPEALHKLIIQEVKTAKSGIDEILKVLPLYIIPSQAERNFKGGDK